MRKLVRCTSILAVGCLAAVALTGAASGSASPAVVANHLTLASTANPETATNGSIPRAVSGNGRWIVFSSWQPNLIPGAPNDAGIYLYLYDVDTAVTTQVSHGQLGSVSGNAAISADGRYVVYSAAETPQSDNKLYLYDRVAATTTVISGPEKPYERQNTGVGFAVDISADGSQVVYTRSSGHDSDHIVRHLYGYDVATGTTALVIPGDLRGTIDRVEASAIPSISADGRYVSYLQSTLTDPTLGSKFTLVRLDTVTGTKQNITTSGYGYFGLISDPSMSDSGRYVVYGRFGTGAQANLPLVYRYDAHTQTSALVSRNAAGLAPNDTSGEGQISGDGRYVVYSSDATDIVAGSGGHSTLYRYDTAYGTTESIIRDRQGNYLSGVNNIAYLPYIDRNGDTVAFVSQSHKLVAGLTTHLERVYAWRG